MNKRRRGTVPFPRPLPLTLVATENPYIANPVTIIDKHIIWFGEPFSNANFISQGQVIPTLYRLIFRLEGKHAARTLCELLEMSPS